MNEFTPEEQKTPFDGDRFNNRKQFAKRLTQLLPQLKENNVIAIDSPWGSGKTWFATNWQQQLESEEHKVIYIDAFANDHLPDPFGIISAAILEAFPDNGELSEQTIRVLGAVTKGIAKIGLNIIAKQLGTNGDELFNLAGEVTKASSEVFNQYLDEEMNKYRKSREAIAFFKEKLKEVCLFKEKPVIIFIDELDRCKPDFAISFLERIKHFFDIPNLVFIMFIHREQLEIAIKGVYGADTDANIYLNKFVHLFFEFPNTHKDQMDSITKNFMIEKLAPHAKLNSRESQDLLLTIATICRAFDFTIRELERFTSYFILTQTECTYANGYMVALKIWDNSLFNKLKKRSFEAHEIMVKFLGDRIAKFDQAIDIEPALQLHKLVLGQEFDKSTLFERFKTRLDHTNLNVHDLFNSYATKILEP